MKGLKKLEEYALENHVPIIRPLSREILAKEVAAKNPSKILEIGTAIGFSGCLMLNSAPNSTLITIEIDEKSFEVAKQNFAEAGFTTRVNQILGDASEIVKTLEGKFDFIFLDGPKSQYVKQLPYLVNLLSVGGVLLAEETARFPRVSRSAYLLEQERVVQVQLPIGRCRGNSEYAIAEQGYLLLRIYARRQSNPRRDGQKWWYQHEN